MPSTKSIKLTPTQWLEHITRWRESGLTRSVYCQQQNISMHAFGYWLKRHRPQSVPTGQTGALTLVAAKVTSRGAETLPGELILHCPNGSKLHMPSTTPALWLGTLLGQLR